MFKLPFTKEKKIKTKGFFEMRSSEKKKIIRKAVMESTKKQIKLLKEYGYAFSS
jgi:hypothetical protein